MGFGPPPSAFSSENSSLGLPLELQNRLSAWNSSYDDSKLPFETNDTKWLARVKRC